MLRIQDRLNQTVRRFGSGAPATAEAAGRAAPDAIHSGIAGVQDFASARALAEQLGIDVMDNLTGQASSADFVAHVPIAFARRHQMMGLAADNGVMPLAVSRLDQPDVVETVSRYIGRRVRLVLAPADQISAAINLAYQQQSAQVDSVIGSIDPGHVLEELQQLRQHEDLLDTGGRAPVIRLVNMILFEAVKTMASDVHLQPYEDTLIVRTRLDGVLYDSFTLPKALQEEIISRIKVMGRMNIAEKRLPQDGRATVLVGDRVIDLRISSMPTSFGERIVIRLLDKSARLFSLGELGMRDAAMEKFKDLISHEHGIILVTGPTGSGKTTTLYAALQEINSKERNILTLEDPIEYQLEGISQMQVSEKKGMTFASGLRSVLRQDPDIIMVGEIRDHDTAVMAIQSSLTGHLVFSTLHTNDASSAVTRLLDLGIEPYLVASSVIGVLAQRLVRRVCPQCSRPDTPREADLMRLGVDPAGIDLSGVRRGAGCEHCRDTGYKGRIGIFELLLIDEAIIPQIQNHASASQIKQAARQRGMTTLHEDGVARVLAGDTTIEEVMRVTVRSGDTDGGLLV